MALSQIQCLDENHVNVRTNESKPEFFYSEDQRLALEKFLEDGQARFEEHLQTHNIRPFLSDLELEQLSRSVEPYSPGTAAESSLGLGGDSEDTDVSLQYWPERSDDTLPDLELGWPNSAAYRGVSRVTVYTQPPLHGQSHVKEVIRKTIAQAQKVIAIVMDLFTDMDIIKDLLDACYKRKVAVYIILEATGVPHFLKMCERSTIHTGHLKHLRVRSIRGTEFFTRSSKKVCGSQSQKFMFVDGDKAVSGSYSFTWTASRLERNIITMLTGQVVDVFDVLFRDLYLMSNDVNLSKIHLDSEPRPNPAPQTAPAPPPSATVALKLINPKYALVSGSAAANSNCTHSKNETVKVDSVKQTKEAQETSHIHPGLLHLEKANMINYLPVWPEPDPPGDVIGFINIRDHSKPVQAHLMRSELFEVSQAIRFKEPFQMPEQPLPEKACPRSSLDHLSRLTAPKEQPVVQPLTESEKNNLHPKSPDSSQTGENIFLSPSSNPDTVQKDEEGPSLLHSTETQKHFLRKQTEEIHVKCQSSAKNDTASPSAGKCKDFQASGHPQLQLQLETTHTSYTHCETTSYQQSCNITAEALSKTLQGNQTQEAKDVKHETGSMEWPRPEMKYNSNFSSTSEEFFECSDSVIVDSGYEAIVNGMPVCSDQSERDWNQNASDNAVTCSLSSMTQQVQQLTEMTLMAGSCVRESCYDSMHETEQSQCRHVTGVTICKHLELKDTEAGLADKNDRLSEPVSTAQKVQYPETDDGSQLGGESKVPCDTLEPMTDAAVALGVKNDEKETPKLVNNMLVLTSKELNDTDKLQLEGNMLLLRSALLDVVSGPLVVIQKNAEAQPIVFSDSVKDVPQLESLAELHSGFNYTSDLKSATELNDVKHCQIQQQAANHMTPNTNTVHEENCRVPAQLTATVKDCDAEQPAERRDSSVPTTRKNASNQNVDIPGKAKRPGKKTVVGPKIAQHTTDTLSSVRKGKPVGEHTYARTHQENKNHPGGKPRLEEDMRKLRLTSQKSIQTPREVRSGPTKASVHKLHSSNHPSSPAVLGVEAQKYPHGKLLGHNGTGNAVPTSPDKISSRRTAAPSRSTQTQLRHSLTEPSPCHQIPPPKQPQAHPDRTRAVQLGQSSSRQRSAFTKEESPSSSGTSFLRRSRAVKGKTTGSVPRNTTGAQSINSKEQRK